MTDETDTDDQEHRQIDASGYLNRPQDDADSDQEYVYAIGHPHGFAKIGRSKEPQRRLKNHQTSCPYNLWLIAQIPVPDSREIEGQLHEYLADKHRRGEWYELDYDDYDDLFDMARMAASERGFESIDEFREWQERKREAVL